MCCPPTTISPARLLLTFSHHYWEPLLPSLSQNWDGTPFTNYLTLVRRDLFRLSTANFAFPSMWIPIILSSRKCHVDIAIIKMVLQLTAMYIVSTTMLTFLSLVSRRQRRHSRRCHAGPRSRSRERFVFMC